MENTAPKRGLFLLGFAVFIAIVVFIAYVVGPYKETVDQIRVGSDTTGPAELNVASPYAAPEVEDIEAWINSDPLTIASLRGKVVLMDGEPVTVDKYAGEDVTDGVVPVEEFDLYRLLDFGEVQEHTVELQFSENVQVHAFTFGS